MGGKEILGLGREREMGNLLSRIEMEKGNGVKKVRLQSGFFWTAQNCWIGGFDGEISAVLCKHSRIKNFFLAMAV